MPVKRTQVINPQTGAVVKQRFNIDDVPVRLFQSGLAGVEEMDLFMNNGSAWVAAENAAGAGIGPLAVGTPDVVIDVPGEYASDKDSSAGAAGSHYYKIVGKNSA